MPQRRSPRAPSSNVVEDFEFLNTYFVVFRAKVLKDPAFCRFWYNVERQDDKYNVIETYEVQLTKLLVSLGYTFAAFATRSGEVFYKKYELRVPEGFEVAWLRTMACKDNEERIVRLDDSLDLIEYPRFLIDRHIERMVGTSSPAHYHIAPEFLLWRGKHLALSLKENVAYKLKMKAAKNRQQ